MNLLCIGDPHGNIAKLRTMPLAKADAIILTGDLGDASMVRDMAFENIRRRHAGEPLKEYTAAQRARAFIKEYTTGVRTVQFLAKFAPVYLIFGNGEYTDAQTRKKSEKLGIKLPSITQALNAIEDVRIINNRRRRLDDLLIGGIPYFDDDNKTAVQKAKNTLARFGKLDILVIHQPPLSYLDEVRNRALPKAYQGIHVGSKALLQGIRKHKPGIVLCGHIHEGKGKATIGSSTVYNLGECNYRMLKL